MIRIGIVGCGRILAAHLRGYRLLREAGVDTFRITALCARRQDDALMYVQRGKGPPQRQAVSAIAGDPLAIDDEYLSDFQDDIEPKVYTDYREMIAHGPIDAVNDFTSHALHHQIADWAFQHNKHLLSQKPLAVTVAAARRMCEAAEARDCVFGVFENFRHTPETRQLRWLFDSDIGGRLQMVLMGYIGAWWAPDRIVAGTAWRHRLDEAGGIALDMGVHLFDQIRHVAGEIHTVSASTAILEPRRVTIAPDGKITASIDCDADDTFFAHFETEGGVVGQLSASWAGHGGATVIGAGSVYYGDRARVTGSRVTFDDSATGSNSAEPYSFGLDELYRKQAPADRQVRDFPHGIDDSFALSQLDWLEAIRTRRQPETTGREGLADLAAAYAIVESALAGRSIGVRDVLDGTVREYQRPIDARFGLV